MPILSLMAAALALAPAVVSWWTGRAVLSRVDDPVLPELLFERRRKLAAFALGGAVALAILFANDALWAIPLLWIALLVSAYPIRRTLFSERWSALAYLRYEIFSSIGLFGLWLLAGFAPALVTSFAIGLEPSNSDAATRLALWSGSALAIVIALWQYNYTRVFLVLHRAEPLRATARPELMAKLDAIVSRAGPALKRRPEMYRYGAPGGYVMNALALPSLTHPAIALGNTLLATMDDDEVAAVFAHEIAHHEQFTPGRLWRARILGLLLAAITAALPALLLSTFPEAAILTSWCVPLLVIATLGRRAAKRRDAETASDLRATVLTGDPAALARALTKLHVYSRVPRRWPHAVERAATHPSLARRIQALRERRGTLELHMPEVSSRSPFGQRPSAATASAPAVRWLALVLLIMLTMAGELGLALIPLVIVLVRPTLTAAVAATAAIALARVVVGARALAWADPVRQLAALGAVSIAVTMIALAARRSQVDFSRGARNRVTREAWVLIGILAGVVALSALGIAPLASERPASLIGNSLAISAATILLGLGGALLTLPQRWWRAGGVLTCAVALAAGGVLSRDSWPYGRSRRLTWTNASLKPVESVPISGGGLTLAASPNGSAFAVSQYRPQRLRTSDATRWVIGRFGDSSQALRTSEAMTVVFADSETVLALAAASDDSLEVRAEGIATNRTGEVAVAWRERLPSLETAQLIVDRSRRSWLVVGRAVDDAAFLVAADTFGGARPRIHRVAARNDQNETAEAMTQPLVAFPNGGTIWLTLGRFHSGTAALAPVLLALSGSIRWELHGTTAGGERFLEDLDGIPLCGNEIESDGVLCYDRSENATRVWRATASTTIRQITELPPSFDVVHVESVDRLAAAERFGTGLMVVDAAARRGTRLALPDTNLGAANHWTADIISRGTNLLVLSAGRDGATVNRFQIVVPK